MTSTNRFRTETVCSVFFDELHHARDRSLALAQVQQLAMKVSADPELPAELLEIIREPAQFLDRPLA